MKSLRSSSALLASLPALSMLAAGACTPQRFTERVIAAHSAPAVDVPPVTPADEPDLRRLPMVLGEGGRAIDWRDLLAAIDWAEVVILGERHDDAIGHAVKLAIVGDALDRWPASAVSMEFLERDQQMIVDDYLDGIVDVRGFMRRTFKDQWGLADGSGEGKWERWFQPIIDAARERGARVVAANAPRRYVRLARLEGYEALTRLPRERRRLVDLPRAAPMDAYRERFFDVMRRMGEHEDDDGEEEAGPGHHDHHHDHVHEAHLEAMLRSQLVWDATMAGSIHRARPGRRTKVLHIVGAFHSDFGGGLVQQVRARRPWSRILTVSLVPAQSDFLRDEDRRRADVIIYTEPAHK